MSVNYNVSVRNSRLQQVINAIDAGAGSGRLRLGTAGMAVVLSTITLVKPSATVAAGVLTFSGTPLFDPLAAATGVPVTATISDSTGLVVISGLTVGLAGTDIIINLPVISANSIVTFQSGVITGN